MVRLSFKIITILLLVLIGAWLAFFLWSNRSLAVKVNGEAHNRGEEMKVEVRNKFWNKNLCLSSCYPYFLEKKDGTWDRYSYKECDIDDRISVCLGPRDEKVFRTLLPKVSPGVHRITVPVCEDCNLGTVFHEEDLFYSDTFEIR